VESLVAVARLRIAIRCSINEREIWCRLKVLQC